VIGDALGPGPKDANLLGVAHKAQAIVHRVSHQRRGELAQIAGRSPCQAGKLAECPMRGVDHSAVLRNRDALDRVCRVRLDLNAAGVRALRFNLKRGGSEELQHLDRMARRVFEVVGWHVELYVDSRELAGMEQLLSDLPAVSIDHLGLSQVGFKTLLKLAEQGVRVKATGFGRVDFDVRTALKDLNSANPKALMFGTDVPSTRAPRPYVDDDFTLVVETLGAEAASRVFSENALEFYRTGA